MVFVTSIRKENLEINFTKNVAIPKEGTHTQATKGTKRIQHIERHAMIMDEQM